MDGMDTQEEGLYRRLVGLGMMPSAAERAISRAREMGDRLPTAADAWRDAEEDAGPVGQEVSRQGWMYMALLRPSMRPYARVLESRTVGTGRTSGTKHLGPGPHPSGSPQSVHGHGGQAEGVSAPPDEKGRTMAGGGVAGAGGSVEAEAVRQRVAEVHERYAPELARLQTEKEKWTQAEEDAKKAFSLAINKGEVQAGTEAYEQRRDEIVRLRKLKEEAERQWEELHGRALSEILPLLAAEDSMTLQVKHLSRFDAARKQAIAEGVAVFQRLTSRELLPGGAAPVADFKLGGKGRSTFDDGIVRVATDATGVDVVHEMGHWLEAVSPVIHDRCVHFYEERTAGWPLQKLRAVTKNRKYKPGEITRVDKFINPYMGREYVHGNRRYATEILSMGLQHFADEPGELATGDPEYFRFIYDLLRGE